MSASVGGPPKTTVCCAEGEQVEEGKMEGRRVASPPISLFALKMRQQGPTANAIPSRKLIRAWAEDGEIPPLSLLLPHFPLSQTRGRSPIAHLIPFTHSCECICAQGEADEFPLPSSSCPFPVFPLYIIYVN